MLYWNLLGILSLISAACQTITEGSMQWRGPLRNGIYAETGLLKTWPAGGPKMVWSYQGLGAGHGNVGMGKDRVFILGMRDNTGILYAFDYSGTLRWKKEYGPEWDENYIGPR